MPASYQQYPADGLTSTYSIPFPYLDQAHIHLTVNGAEVPFTWQSPSIIKAVSVPPPGATVVIRRSTPTTPQPVDFSEGSVLDPDSLDALAKFCAFVTEELGESPSQGLGASPSGALDARNLRITRLAQGVDPTDAVNKAQLDAVAANAGTGRKGVTIALLGDSLTAQFSVLDEGPGHILERTLTQMGVPSTVVPCGKAGNTFYRSTTQAIYGSQTAVQKVIATNPDVVLVCLGINDTVNSVDGRTAAQVQADATAVFTQLRASLPAAQIYYVGEVPYARDLTSGQVAALKNSQVIPAQMTRRSTGILAGKYSEEILNDNVDAATQARHSAWTALHTHIKSLPTITGSFDVWVQMIHRAGGGSSDRLHFNHAGGVLAAGYMVRGLRGTPKFTPLLSNSYVWWEDPDSLIAAVISGTQPGPAANDALTNGLHPDMWWSGWPVKFRFTPEVTASAEGVFMWTLEGGPPYAPVQFSADGGAWTANIATTSLSGGILAASGGSLMTTLGLSPGAHAFRYSVGDVALGPFTVTVVDGAGSSGGSYTLPAATAAVRGGVRLGDGLAITEGDKLSISPATSAVIGGVKPGTGLSVAADGSLSVKVATAFATGGVKPGTGLSVAADGTLNVTVSGATEGSWQSLSLAGGWAAYTAAGNYPGLRYRIVGNTMQLSGGIYQVGPTGPALGVTIATLPAGQRPAYTGAAAIAGGSQRLASVVVSSDGSVILSVAGDSTVGNIAFFDGATIALN